MIATQPSMSFSWHATILDAAYGQGLLCRAAREKVAFLLERGLHMEQALVGTGLCTLGQYAELIDHCFHIKVERLDRDHLTIRATTQTLPDGVIAAETETGEKVLLVSDAWTDAHAPWGQKKERCIPVFFSDVLRFRRSKTVTDLAISSWWRMWQGVAQHEAKLLLNGQTGQVWMGADGALAESLPLSSTELPAMQAWFEGGYPSFFWRTRRIQGVESDVLELVTKNVAHPVAKMEQWRGFMKKPNGVLVVFAPDAWMLHELEVIPALETHHDAFQAIDLRRIHPQTSEAREAALHAALAGALLCWVELVPEETRWMRVLADAGIRVTVIRRRETLHGSAWEAYYL